MKCSEFVFDYVDSLYDRCPKIKQNESGLNVNTSDWVKGQKVRINLINKKYNECFQNGATVALNNEEIKTYPEKITKNKPFI